MAAANEELTASITAIKDDEEVMQQRIAEKTADLTDPAKDAARRLAEVADKRERLALMVAERDRCRQAVHELGVFRREAAARLEERKQEVLAMGLGKAAAQGQAEVHPI